MGSPAVEDAALDRLLAYLREQGCSATIQARPDRSVSAAPAVDAELMINGMVIGVEVTQIVPGARAHAETGKLERCVEQRLIDEVRARHLGAVVIAIDSGALPAKVDVQSACEPIAKAIRSAIKDLGLRPGSRRDLPVIQGVPFVRRLELIQFPSRRSEISWVVSSDEFGGWIGSLADAFVAHLLDRKARQTASYAEAWIVIVDRTGQVGPTDVASALHRRADQVPPNWRRVWFLPATDRSSVVMVRFDVAQQTTP